MKKMFILSIAAAGIFTSCKKSDSSPSYSMSANVAGTTKNFNAVTPIAQKVTVNDVTTITVTGVLSTSTGESMIIALDNSNGGGPIVAGKYADSSSLYNLSANYIPALGSLFQGGSIVWELASATSQPINHFVLNITSISSTSIHGSFSGDLFSYGDPSAAVKSVTNGSFNAKFQ
ncbi:MAG: hypothetical protein P4L51_18755 [Puia sp.]|nr:hypothetical protein [Puia sp.]